MSRSSTPRPVRRSLSGLRLLVVGCVVASMRLAKPRCRRDGGPGERWKGTFSPGPGVSERLTVEAKGRRVLRPHLINVAEQAYQSHVDHGDGSPGEAVPGMDGYNFGEDCLPEVSVCAPVDADNAFIGTWHNDDFDGSLQTLVFSADGCASYVDDGAPSCQGGPDPFPWPVFTLVGSYTIDPDSGMAMIYGVGYCYPPDGSDPYLHPHWEANGDPDDGNQLWFGSWTHNDNGTLTDVVCWYSDTSSCP